MQSFLKCVGFNIFPHSVAVLVTTTTCAAIFRVVSVMELATMPKKKKMYIILGSIHVLFGKCIVSVRMCHCVCVCVSL